MVIQEAITLFDAGEYRKAFEVFANAYNVTQNLQEKKTIMSMLQEAYYQPNKAELRDNYDKNVKALEEYPYFWDKQFDDFSALSFLLFPVSDDSYYLYDKMADRFVGEYDGTTRHRMRYFFDNLDHALRVEDEDNLYNLTFLFDNVRRSEDVAMDNHIYLLYHSWEPLQRVMQVGDLVPILEHQKFVFLMGQKNFDRYPIDFKSEWGVDYGTMKPQPVRIEEIKRICYWYKHAHSGSVLSQGLLGAFTTIQVENGHDFHTFSKFHAHTASEKMKTVISNVDGIISIDDLERWIRPEEYDIHLKDLEEYVNHLKNERKENPRYTFKEIFVAYFLFHYNKRKLNSRITPLLFYDPHIWDSSFYTNLILSFPYKTVLTCVREPIMTFMRCCTIGIVGWNDFQDRYILAADYVHAQFLSNKLLPEYYGWRFEDLKRVPDKLLPMVCKHLNVPFESTILQEDVPMTDCYGHTVKGFDQSPLQYNLEYIMSDFDKLRLQIFYEPIHKYYGYAGFDSEEYPLSEQEVRKLFSYPFRFERLNLCKTDADQLHERVQWVLQKCWKKNIIVPKLIKPIGEN